MELNDARLGARLYWEDPDNFHPGWGAVRNVNALAGTATLLMEDSGMVVEHPISQLFIRPLREYRVKRWESRTYVVIYSVRAVDRDDAADKVSDGEGNELSDDYMSTDDSDTDEITLVPGQPEPEELEEVRSEE